MERRDFIKKSMGTALAIGALSNVSATGIQGFYDITGSENFKELKLHRFDGIEFTSVKLNYPRPVGLNAIRGPHGSGPTDTVVTLKTDRGASGWGLMRTNTQQSKAAFEAMKGKPITDFFTVEKGVFNDTAKSFDIALHDLAGQIFKKPVYQLLGPNKPFVAPCYSGMIYFDDLDQPTEKAGFDKILEECQYDYNYGYRQLKVKIGRGNKYYQGEKGLKRDIDITKLIHKSFPDCDILVDGNDGFNVKGIIEYLKGIGDLPLFWLEEPFAETVEDYKILREFTKTNSRIKHYADGEANTNIDLVYQLGDQKLIDVCLADIIGYGFTPWLYLMPVLKNKKLLASPHNWGSQLKTFYTIQLVGALGNTPTIEGVTCTSDDVDFGDYKLVNGKYTPSNAPGFGLKLIKKNV